MSEAAYEKIREGLEEALEVSRQTVGFDWLQPFRESYPEEFEDEDQAARRHVETESDRPAQQKRYGS